MKTLVGVAEKHPENVRFHSCGSDTLIVWFSGINEPFISENLVAETTCDVLSLRDLKLHWYMSGILAEHGRKEDGFTWLEGLSSSYRRTVFVGQSSGGYAALLYGKNCGADLIIAFSPQTRNMRNGQNAMTPHIPIQDLRSVYRADDDNCPIVLNIGQSEDDHEDKFFWDDWRQIAPLRSLPYVTLIVHPFHNHSVSGSLKKEKRLYSFITGLIGSFLRAPSSAEHLQVDGVSAGRRAC